MTELDIENAYIAFMKNTNATYYYNKFLEAIKSRDSKAIEESKVFEVLHRMICVDNPMKRTLQNETLFRCRIIKSKDWDTSNNGIGFEGKIITGFDKYNSKEPPLGLSPKGRANFSGATYLYVADNPYTACAEVRPRLKDCISVGQFEISKPLTIIDFSEDQNLHSIINDEDTFSVAKLITRVMVQFCSCVNDIDEYIVTQYISDYIRKHGIDGICYRSSLTDGKNYAIFNCSEDNIRFVSSEIYYCHNIEYQFVDINKGRNCSKTQNSPKPKIRDMCMQIKQEIGQILANRQHSHPKDNIE